MATRHIRLRIPEGLAREMDRWISEGRFFSWSDAVRSIIALYEKREHARKFYLTLLRRSDEARRSPESLTPLEIS